MAEYAMPFDFDEAAADPEEYEYSAAEERMFNMAQRTNGVYPQVRVITNNIVAPESYVGQSLLVSPWTGGMGVVVSKGLASLEGIDYINTEPKVIPFDSPSGQQVYDIVVQVDFITQKAAVIKQLRSSGATLQGAILRTADKYQICIATVTVPAGAGSIALSNIVDQRLNTTICPADGKPICGLVAAAAQADTRMILEAYLAQLGENQRIFEDWFAGAQSVLDGDAAGNLLNLINQTKATSEPLIPTGTTAQYRRGDKTWQDLAAAVRAIVLTGLSTATNAAITAADTILGALGKLQAQVTAVQAQITAVKSKLINTTLSTSWAGSAAPYTQTVSVAGMTATANGYFDITPSATEAQLKAFESARLVIYSQAANSVTLRAWGSKPTINIPVTFVIVG